MDKENSNNVDNGMSYDLRQVYAVDIVGEHLKDIARARKADNYSIYLKSLKDLYIVVQHKIKGDVKIKDGDTIKKITKKEYYNLLTINAAQVVNKYPQEFLQKGSDSNGCAAIEEALNAIEMFLYTEIEDAKMFGNKWDDEGL